MGHKPSYCNSQMLTTICLITALEMAAPTCWKQTNHIHAANPYNSTRLPKSGWGDFGDEILEHKRSSCHSPSEWCFSSMIRRVCTACFVETWSLRFEDTRHTGIGYLRKTVLHRTEICCSVHPYHGWSRAWTKQSRQLWAGFLSEGTSWLQKSS